MTDWSWALVKTGLLFMESCEGSLDGYSCRQFYPEPSHCFLLSLTQLRSQGSNYNLG